MKRERSHCPIAFALDSFGDPWTLLIVRDLALKRRRTYTEFLHGGEKISTNILADRLDRLLSAGIVERVDGEGGYRLRPKGIDLIPLLLEMIAWSAKHDPHTAAGPDFVARIHADRTRLESELRAIHSSPSSPGVSP